jgi:hypothetical protein
VSTKTLCDGCGDLLAVESYSNYWHCEFMGDTTHNQLGQLMSPTGMTAPGNHPYIKMLVQADLCIPCMSKTQGETT